MCLNERKQKKKKNNSIEEMEKWGERVREKKKIDVTETGGGRALLDPYGPEVLISKDDPPPTHTPPSPINHNIR